MRTHLTVTQPITSLRVRKRLAAHSAHRGRSHDRGRTALGPGTPQATGLGFATRGGPLEGGRAEAMHRYRPAVPPPHQPSMIARDESQPIDSQMLVSAISCRIVLASPSCPEAAEIEGPT